MQQVQSQAKAELRESNDCSAYRPSKCSEGPDHGVFIRATTRLLPVPVAPDMRLYTADEATALWEKTEEELGQAGLPPPFWAFPWAGGQALARYLLDRPEVVRGRTVLDVASGSGLVAIAAARAGASRVSANDIDLFAQAAIRLNASENHVTVDVLPGDRAGTDEGWDVVLAGDVSYERDMAERLLGWFDALRRRGALVLLGDPGRTYLPRDRLVELAAYDVPVSRALEDADLKHAAVWRLLPPIDKPAGFVEAARTAPRDPS